MAFRIVNSALYPLFHDCFSTPVFRILPVSYFPQSAFHILPVAGVVYTVAEQSYSG